MIQDIEAKDRRINDLESQLRSSEALLAKFQRSLQQRDLELETMKVNPSAPSLTCHGVVYHILRHRVWYNQLHSPSLVPSHNTQNRYLYSWMC